MSDNQEKTSINTAQLKTMIASQIKDMNLNSVLDANAVETIKDKVMQTYNHEKAKSEIPDMIPEGTISRPMEIGIFPEVTSDSGSTSHMDSIGLDKELTPTDLTQVPGQNVDMSTTGNIPVYTPELPSFLEKIEPAKVIIFSQNELSEGGENLSHKPLRTFADPDIKESMNDFWIDKGQKKADVYLAKLEKIGELDFNFANGTTVFIEKRFDPDFETQAKYKENPYMSDNVGPALPGSLDINGQPNITNQIVNSVDINKVVTDIVMNILRNQLLTNTEKAVSSEAPMKSVGEFAGNFDTSYSGQMSEGFSIKMLDLVNSFEKIDSPKTLKEAIDKDDKSCLVRENEEVQEWLIESKKYYTPVNKISNRKCYTK